MYYNKETMKKYYDKPDCQAIVLDTEALLITNSNGQTGGIVPGMGWGNKGGAAERRSDWDEYENK